MNNIIVKYNGRAFSPTPLVSRSYQFLDYGPRWGQIESITLNGYVTGITSPSGAIASITDYFTGQFKTLEVFEDSTPLYTWSGVIVDQISFQDSPFYKSGFTPFSAQLTSYQVPSGVIDPSNEYSFNQNEDGTVNVTHKISAKGIRSGTVGALDNAIKFVKTFVGKNPYSSCIPAFIPSGSGILLSRSENINRPECIYSVEEIYQFNTGVTAPYIETTSLNITDVPSEKYINLDLTVNWKGSPFEKLTDLQSAIGSFNPYLILQNNYKIETGNLWRNTFSLTQNSGEASIQIQVNFFSGISSEATGFFDYSIGMEYDVRDSNVWTWKIDGELLTYGPLPYRRQQVQNFKNSASQNRWIPFLQTCLQNAYITEGRQEINPVPVQLNIVENTGMATLKISATFNDKDFMNGFADIDFTADIEPSFWMFDMVPSANIEGHYIIQDLNMRNQAKMKYNVSAVIASGQSPDLTKLDEFLKKVEETYVGSGFLMARSVNTGIQNISVSCDYIGQDKMSIGLLNNKIYGSLGDGYLRPAGYNFGY